MTPLSDYKKYDAAFSSNFFSRSSQPEVFLGKDVLKTCCKFTGEHSCPSVVSIKLLCNFIEITFRYGCSPVNLLHIFRTPFPKNIYGQLRLLFLSLNFGSLESVTSYSSDKIDARSSSDRTGIAFKYN